MSRVWGVTGETPAVTVTCLPVGALLWSSAAGLMESPVRCLSLHGGLLPALWASFLRGGDATGRGGAFPLCLAPGDA